MFSRIYFGKVRHRRFKPDRHEFKYAMFMLYIDLDELPNLFKKFWFWSINKFNLASFNPHNYLCDEQGDIKRGVQLEVFKQLGFKPNGPIRMLTHLSYFGYCFNPVTFYYCFNSDDNQLDCIVAQINNTPWDQRYCYVLDNRIEQTKNNSHVKADFDKKFHVSPFLPMNMQYLWNFSQPDERLTVYMKNTQSDEKCFDVNLMLTAKPINSINLAKALLRFPLMTWQVAFAIHWQALKLWLKKTPFYDNPDLKTPAVLKKNSSIKNKKI